MKRRILHSLLPAAAVVLIIFTAAAAGAATIRIVTPYLGSIRNVYENEEQGLDLEDASLLKGLYLQWIDTERFQTNLFVYQSSNINYSTLWGIHYIFDWYYDVQENQKNVIGLGLDYIRLDMDAGDNISPLSDFALKNNITVPFIRAGRYFYFGGSNFRSYALPWFGFEYELVRGDLSFAPPFSPQVITKKIHSDYLFALAGVKLKTTIYHFVELELKTSLAFNPDEVLPRVAGMANLYLSRQWGLSYRFMYNENISGSNLYHLGGVSYVF